MSKVYAQAPSGVAERVAHLVKVMFPDLKDAGVRIDLLSVADDDPDVEHALKVRGVPAYGCCKAVDIKGRTMGRGDAEIIIDEAKYITLPDATKDALLAHELNHIELQLGKKGKVKLDCVRRPKIKMRPHCIEVGWFTNIASKFGAASIEVKQATQIYLEHKQTLFSFAMDADLMKRLEKHSGDSVMDRVMDRVMSDAEAGRNIGGLSKLARDHGATIEISSGGKSVTIGKEGVVPAGHPDPDSTNG